MARMQTSPWDAAEHLETDEDAVAYLDAALEHRDEALILAVQGDIARARQLRAAARRGSPDHGAG